MKTNTSKALLAGALVMGLASLPGLALAQLSGWGDNRNGQFLYTSGSEISPVAIPLAGDLRAALPLAGGVLGLRPDGSVVGWGRNQWGFFGPSADGTLLTSPTLVPGLTGVVEIGVGNLSAYALTASRDLYSWGYNFEGQLGQGSLTYTSPIGLVGRLNPGDRFVAGMHHLFVIRADGTLEASGRNTDWQLNTADPYAHNLALAPIPGIPPVKDVSGNRADVLAVTSDGTVMRWGGDSAGYYNVRRTPVAVEGLANIKRVFSGGGPRGANFAIDEDNRLWSWGFYDAALGRIAAPGEYDPGSGYAAPALVSGLPPIAKVTIANSAVLALGTDGSVWSWGGYGSSSADQLGYSGASLNVQIPHRVPNLGAVGDLAADYSVLALGATTRLTGFSLAETTTRGYRNVKGTVTLDKPAGPGGVRVALSARTFAQNVPNGLPTSGSALKLTAVPSPRPSLRKVWRVRNTTNITRYLTAWTLFAPQAQSVVVAPNSDAYFVTQAWPGGIPSLELLFEGTNYVSLAISNNQLGDTPLNVFANYAVPAEVIVPEGQTSYTFDVFANEVPVDARAEIVATKGDASFTQVLKTVLESDRPKP